MSVDPLSFLGIGLTIIGSICDATGFVIQKKGHLQVIEQNNIIATPSTPTSPNHVPRKRKVWFNKTWLCGFAIYIVGSIINAVALGFGAQSILAPLRSITLVANAILATKVLKEPFDPHKWIGILLVIVGSVLSVLFGPSVSEDTDSISLNTLQDYWLNRSFLYFFGSWTFLIASDYLLLKVYEYRNWNNTEDKETIIYGAKFMMISYVIIAAFWAALNMLLQKSLMTVLATFKPKYFKSAFLYLTIIPIIPVNIWLEIFRQRALHYFDANYVIPLYQVLFVLGSIIMGGVFFQEFSNLENTDLIVFPVSIAITLAGVAILAYDVGAMLNKMTESLKVKTEQTLNVRGQVLKEFLWMGSHLNVFSAWGGISQFGAEYVARQQPKEQTEHSHIELHNLSIDEDATYVVQSKATRRANSLRIDLKSVERIAFDIKAVDKLGILNENTKARTV